MVTPGMLAQVSLFEGLKEEQLEAIADFCEEITFRQGEVIFWEGDPAEVLHVLLHGEITIFVQLSSRPERVTVSVLSQPYQPFGWSGVVAPHLYTASALCEQDSRLLAIDGEALVELMGQDPVLGYTISQRIAEVISSRLRNTRGALLKTL